MMYPASYINDPSLFLLLSIMYMCIHVWRRLIYDSLFYMLWYLEDSVIMDTYSDDMELFPILFS